MQQAMPTPMNVTAEPARAGAGRRASSAPAGVSASDRDLVARLLIGEEAAFIGLVSRYHGSLVRLARAFVDSRDAAEDVAQETWLAVLNGLESFEGRGTLKGWIFRILVNRAKTRGQRDKRWVPLSDGAGDPDGEAAVDRGRFSARGSWVQPPEPRRRRRDCSSGAKRCTCSSARSRSCLRRSGRS